MAATTTKTDVSAETWESLKEVIRSYYLDQNLQLEGPGGVVEKMAQIHDLHASKQQYEKCFRKWNFRKNLPKEGWITIARTLRKRDQDGLQSEVYIFNKLMPERKIRKEISRYKAEIESTKHNERIDSLPACVRIATPVNANAMSLACSSTSYSRNCDTPNIGSSLIELNGFSFFEFEKFVHEYGHHSAPGSIEFYNSGSHSIFQTFESNTTHASLSLPYRMSLEAQSNDFPSMCYPNDDWTQTELFHPQSDLRINLGHQRLSNAIQSLKLLVFLITNNLANADTVDEFFKHITIIGDLRAFRSFLLCPGETADAFAEKMFPQAVKAQNTALVKCLLERGTNPDNYIVEATCNSYLVRPRNAPWFADSITDLEIQMTPLTFACEKGNVELIRTLLDAGADVNKPVVDMRRRYLLFECECLTPLALAISQLRILHFAIEGEPANEIVRILLEAGADINPSLNMRPRVGYVLPLTQAALVGDCPTLKLLLEHGADVNRIDWTCETALSKSFRYSNELSLETASKIQETLIQAGADLKFGGTSLRHLSRPSRFRDIQLKMAIDYAALNGNMELFELIWNINPTLSEHTIECAAKSGNLHLVQWLLRTAKDDSILRESFTGFELAAALENRRLEMAELLLQCKVIPYSEESMQFTFEWAVKTRQRGIIEQLLAIALENQDDWNLSRIASVAAAVSTDQYDIAEYLINCGGRVDIDALAAAVRKGSETLVQKLLEVYEDSIASIESGFGLLQAAIELGNPAILKTVIDLGFMRDPFIPDCVRLIDTAVKNKKFDILHMLLNAGASPSCKVHNPYSSESSPLALAASRSDINGLRILLNAGADPEDTMALYQAARVGNLYAIRLLLEAYPKSNKTCRKGYGCEALGTAINGGHLEMVRVLLSYGVCPNIFNYGRNAMGRAIEQDDPERVCILREILSVRMDPNGIVSLNGPPPARTALIHAIKCKNLPAVKLLIDSGANVNLPATRRTRQTPLQAACEVGYLEVVVLLLSHNADINAPPADVGGATALQFAAIGGHVGIASILVNNGANINAPAAKVQGRTALEGAAEHGRFDMVKFLLNAGVCITGSGEKQYLRALKFASGSKHGAIKKTLELASTVYIASSS